jgi:RNA polymerase sigma factor (sigma-70 family)
METAVAYYDPFGVPINPLVLSLCTQTRTSYKFAPLKSRVAQFKPAVPEYPPYPPYRGEYKSRMQEWSQTGRANAAKFHARELNETHTEFLAGNLELDRYMVEVFAFLERDDQNDHEDVLAFFTTIQDKLESGCFCPEESTTRFSAKLLKAWTRYQRDNNIQVADEENLLPQAPTLEPPAKALAPNRVNIEAAYRKRLAGTDGAERDFYKIVYRFAKMRVRDKLNDSVEGIQTFEDCAQTATIAVWESIGSYKGQPEGFYSWLRRICGNVGKDGFKKNMREAKGRVPLMVSQEDGTVVENPELYENEFWVEMQRELPEFIQGDNLKICQYIREGFDYEKIAQVLSMTEAAVKQRVAWMRKTIEEMRATGEKV